jgi:hypothetical protein
MDSAVPLNGRVDQVQAEERAAVQMCSWTGWLCVWYKWDMRPFFAISVFGKCEVRTAVLTRQCRVCVTAPAGIICDKFPGTDTGSPLSTLTWRAVSADVCA